MDIKLTDEQIARDFPFLQADIECGEGWYGLIYNMLTEISNACKETKVPIENIDVVQIKEKFGQLTCYVSFHKDSYKKVGKRIYRIIDNYMRKSTHVCEFCGKPGELKRGPWTKTICNDCLERINNETC